MYRSLELPLPKQLPYASKEIRKRWADLLARFMPFDLVIDEHTADGQEARVSKTSVAGSWGAVAGSLRFFADRFGIPRASIEGTTLSYDLVREHAALGQPRVVRHRARASTRGWPSSAGDPTSGSTWIPTSSRCARSFPSRSARRRATRSWPPCSRGETAHPDQGRLKRWVAVLDELWRRSGGTLADRRSGRAARGRSGSSSKRS